MSSRVPIAVVAGLLGFTAYLAVAVVLGDAVVGAHWTIQALYYLVAGSLWVLPVRWLMYWGAGQR
jgi:hypothetical protein